MSSQYSSEERTSQNNNNTNVNKIDNNINVAQDTAAITTTLMSTEDDKTWYDANEEYDLWHNAAETMNNYQEWTDPQTVLKEANKTESIIKHIKLHVHEGKHHTGSLKSNISAPNTGYQFMHSMFY